MLPVKTNKSTFKYTICVSGAASGHTVKESADKAEALGRAIARSGQILTTGATVGLPYYAAVGAKKENGMSIGFSPATNLREHLRKYRLPRDCFDFINFTGMKYSGRDLYLIQSSDAVITVGGRFGSLQEFASALELHKPAGVLLGSGGTADLIPQLMEILEPPDNELVIFDKDPDRLVKRMIEQLDLRYSDIHAQLDKLDQTWYLRHEAQGSHSG